MDARRRAAAKVGTLAKRNVADAAVDTTQYRCVSFEGPDGFCAHRGTCCPKLTGHINFDRREARHKSAPVAHVRLSQRFPSVLFRWFLVDVCMLEKSGLSTCITTYTGWKTCEIGDRQGANRKQVGHLLRIRNAAWRRFSSGFRQGTNGTGH